MNFGVQGRRVVPFLVLGAKRLMAIQLVIKNDDDMADGDGAGMSLFDISDYIRYISISITV